MKNNKRRLLKDLPFENITKGKVLYKVNGSYQISKGSAFYEVGGSSDNGIQVLDITEREIVDVIWDNENWFKDADLNHIDFIPSNNSITLRFDPIDIDDAEDLTRGLIHILKHLEDGSYIWNKFKNITTKIKNR